MWHKLYSLKQTKYFGRVACHVTSKCVGTGMSERSWKDIEIVCSCQRSGVMKSDTTEKQSILYGSAKMKKNQANGDCKFLNWSYMKIDLGLEQFERLEHKREGPKKRTFYAFIKDWEVKLLKKNNQAAGAKLLKKYSRIRFIDDVDSNLYEVAPENLEFTGKRKERGWSVIGQPIGYKESDGQEKLVSRFINSALFELIKKTPQNPDLHIEILTEEDLETDSDESEDEDEEGNAKSGESDGDDDESGADDHGEEKDGDSDGNDDAKKAAEAAKKSKSKKVRNDINMSNIYIYCCIHP